jgi:hypothetical protein
LHPGDAPTLTMEPGSPVSDVSLQYAIAGHSSFSKLFPLSVGEMAILRDRNVYTVSQLLEVNDLTGHLTVDENRPLFTDLAIYPHLQHKLRLLIRSLRRAPVVDNLSLLLQLHPLSSC